MLSDMVRADTDYHTHDRTVWQRVFATMPEAWYEAPPSDAMRQCQAYFLAHPCRRVLDVGCGFGRWAPYLVGHGVAELIGLDYAENGVRAALAWARRAGFNATFVVGAATALPFCGRSFDGVLAAVLLDNLSRDDCRRAVRQLTMIAQPGARGFFVFNPQLTAAELAAVPEDNPTKGCMHVVYEDAELEACLPEWVVTRTGVTAEKFRVVEATLRADRP